MRSFTTTELTLSVMLAAILVRTTFLLLVPQPFVTDPDAYRDLAIRWRNTGQYARASAENTSFPTAFRPPVYPALLALLVSEHSLPAVRVGIVHILLGAGTVVLTFLIGTKLGCLRGRWLAAVIVAFDPLLLEQSRLLMTETLATFLATGLLASACCWWDELTPRRAILIGAGLGLALLCRPVFLVVAVILGLALLMRRTPWRLTSLSMYVVGLAMIVAPWMARNYMVFGVPLLCTTHGGYTLLLANNDSMYDHITLQNWWEPWDATKFHEQWSREPSPSSAQEELTQDQHASALGWNAIRLRPPAFAASVLFRWLQLVNPLPYAVEKQESSVRRGLRYLVAIWYVALYLAAIVGLRRLCDVNSRGFAVLFATLIVSTFAVHTLYWTNIRMRAPLIPGLAILAGLAFCARSPAVRRLSTSEKT